jgi:hypothetical protein
MQLSEETTQHAGINIITSLAFMERSFERFSDLGYPGLDVGLISLASDWIFFFLSHHLRHGLAAVWLFEDFWYPWVDQIPAFPQERVPHGKNGTHAQTATMFDLSCRTA